MLPECTEMDNFDRRKKSVVVDLTDATFVFKYDEYTLYFYGSPD